LCSFIAQSNQWIGLQRFPRRGMANYAAAVSTTDRQLDNFTTNTLDNPFAQVQYEADHQFLSQGPKSEDPVGVNVYVCWSLP
jgi:hypothetical protein